jgi:hypothetical protein
MEVVEMFVPIAFFAMIVLLVYFTSKYNYQTKKALLEKGVNIELTKRRFPFLEIGFTAIGIGLGLALAVFPLASNLSEESKGLLIAAFTTLFGGVGLVTAFLIRRRLDEKK